MNPNSNTFSYPNYVAPGTLVDFSTLREASKVCQNYKCPNTYSRIYVEKYCGNGKDYVCNPGYSVIRNSPSGLAFPSYAYNSQYTNPSSRFRVGKNWEILEETNLYPGSQIYNQ